VYGAWPQQLRDVNCPIPVGYLHKGLNRGKASQKLVHTSAMAIDKSRQLDFTRLLAVVFDIIDEVDPH
jgi:hypothetical protein